MDTGSKGETGRHFRKNEESPVSVTFNLAVYMNNEFTSLISKKIYRKI